MTQTATYRTTVMEHRAIRLMLLLLAGWGFWTLWVFPYRNGLLEILQSKTKPGAVLPGPVAAPMKLTYIGIKSIDKQLAILVSFFYTAIDGNRLDVSLQFFDLGGQVLAAWMLITLEALRRGNKGIWVITSTTVFGLAVAIVGFACVAPIWFVMHLSLSPTAFAPKADQLMVNSPLQLAIAPVSILIGFGVPSAIMCLPAPGLISFQTKQLWTGIQQGWPIWIACVQFVLTNPGCSSLMEKFTGSAESDQKAQTMEFYRRAYIFAATSSTAAHLLPWTISFGAFASQRLFDHMQTPLLQPIHLFVPVFPFGDRKAETLADGAFWFLQWDLIVGTIATLSWATALRLACVKREANWTARNFFGVIITALLMGPCGAAAMAVWARDEEVLEGAAGTKRDKAL